MNHEPIAVVTDSACDLPHEYVAEQEHLYVLPLQLIYPERSYRSGVEITEEEVYERMERGEVPTTALPLPEDVEHVFEDLRAKGIRQAVFVMMSSGLSGTFNMVCMMCQEHAELRSLVYDSKILSMGLGYMVMNAIDLIRQRVAFSELRERLEAMREDVDGFFYLNTLDYLRRGGRIGLVAGTVGKLLNIRPFITVNEEGKYAVRAACMGGAKRMLRQAAKLVSEFAGERKFELTVMSGNAMDEAQKLLEELKRLPGAVSGRLLKLSPALSVHTGPGMIAVLTRRVCIEP